MAYTFNLNRLLNDIRGPKGVGAISEELVKIRSEFKKVSSRFQPEAEKRLKDLQKNILVVRKSFENRIKIIEKEIQTTLKVVKKSATKAESRLQKAMGSQPPAKRTTKKAKARTSKRK
jgi:hypothetical protein